MQSLVRIVAMLVAALIALAPAYAQKRIAFSFDDIPRGPGAFMTPGERTQRLIEGMRKAGVAQAVFFVNPGNLAYAHHGDGEAHIRAYVQAGHVIANHSFSHPHLNEMTAEAYLADIDRAEEWLKGRPGYRPWFRFPFLDEGGKDKARRDAVRAGLAARGLSNGYVTVDGADWNMENLTVEAKKAGKPIDMEALRKLYVETMLGAARFDHDLMIRAIGRSPAHVFLLHETDLAALFLPDLVAALKADGWEIISADEAYADPIAKLMPDVPSANGSLTEALAWEKDLPAPRWYESNNVALANRVFAERVLHEKPAQ